MSQDVYKITEVVGTSKESQEDAIRQAIRRTAETVKHLDWFQVTDSRGYIEGGDVKEWQVSVKIGFKVET